MRSVALDLGVKKTTFCEVSGGQVAQRATVTCVSSLKTVLGPEQAPARVAIEACRSAWYAYEVLTGWGNEVLLVDTTRSRQMGVGQHGRKTDRVDAELLAKAVERGGIPLAHVLSPARRELRRLIGVRRNLVEARARFVVAARGLAREQGARIASCQVHNFAVRARASALPESLMEVLEPLLVCLETLNVQVERVETQLTELSASEPIIQLLCTAPGVGPLVAAAFVSVVDEAKRFERAHRLESYLGLVPGENSSGGVRRIGGITKKGNPYLRAMLVQAAWNVVRKESSDPLCRWGKNVMERRGKKIGVVAVARRLAGILWAMWKNNSAYDAERLRTSSVRGLRHQAQDILVRAEALKQARRKTTGKFSVREAHV